MINRPQLGVLSIPLHQALPQRRAGSLEQLLEEFDRGGGVFERDGARGVLRYHWKRYDESQPQLGQEHIVAVT